MEYQKTARRTRTNLPRGDEMMALVSLVAASFHQVLGRVSFFREHGRTLRTFCG